MTNANKYTRDIMSVPARYVGMSDNHNHLTITQRVATRFGVSPAAPLVLCHTRKKSLLMRRDA
jgi:hypothetical protein